MQRIGLLPVRLMCCDGELRRGHSPGPQRRSFGKPPDDVGRPYAGGGNRAKEPAGGTAPAHNGEALANRRDDVGRPYAGGGIGTQEPAGGTAPAHNGEALVNRRMM